MTATDAASARHGGFERWTAEHRTAADALLALALAVVLGALSASGASGMGWPRGSVIALVVSFAVLHATVAFRLRSPQPAFVLASLAMLAVALVPDAQVTDAAAGSPQRLSPLVLPSCLVFFVLLYAAASRAPARRALGALAVGVAGAVLAAVRLGDTLASVAAKPWLASVYAGIALVITVALTWWLGRLAASRRVRADLDRQQSARAAVRAERARIARDMHDIVAHSLAVIVRQAEGGAYVAASRPDQAADALAAIARTGRHALADMRGLLGVLRETRPDGDPGPQPGLADVAALVANVRASVPSVDLDEHGERFALGAASELAAYRVVQEALTNVVKHAGPDARAAVAIDWGASSCTVEITDSGGSAAAVPGAGAGLSGLRDRCAAVGAAFTAGPHGAGYRVRAVFPRPDEEIT